MKVHDYTFLWDPMVNARKLKIEWEMLTACPLAVSIFQDFNTFPKCHRKKVFSNLLNKFMVPHDVVHTVTENKKLTVHKCHILGTKMNNEYVI